MDQLPSNGEGLGPDMVKRFTHQLINGNEIASPKRTLHVL